MTSGEVRSKFIEFFEARGHTPVASASLIPDNDPTLLFTNAGMVPFKAVFLGDAPRPYPRAVSAQKCMRAGGKHNDLENVGQTARHQTFFEMLGNFSFGDYFKDDAISFAWELLTKVYQLPADRLWITIFREDDEAAGLWRQIVPSRRVIRLDEKDNFWQMGDIGPCGPCSEVLFDQGEAVHPDCPGIGKCDCDRYLEIWNLVFMQHNRDAEGLLTPLPKPSIDTGMGLERMTAVCQGVLSNYETDLFQPIFQAISHHANLSEAEVTRSAPGRVIADHVRALTFLAGDGVAPANEGRGYLFRRILRRAARFGRQFGFCEPFLHTLTGTVIDRMSEAYPGLEQERDHIDRVVLGEEERFIRTLDQGVQLIDEAIKGLKGKGAKTIPGETLFTLYDTYGFPIDLAEEIASEMGMKLDTEGFEQAMSEQKKRARRAWAGAEKAGQSLQAQPLFKVWYERYGETRFVGYDRLEEETILLAILKEGQSVSSAQAGDKVGLLFQSSPFYAESGGQVGDQGKVVSDTATVLIGRTEKVFSDLCLHYGKVMRGAIAVDKPYRAIVDKRSRQDTAKNHTGTHLLHAALRNLLGDHVKQAGSLVAPDRLRFDFQHFAALTDREIEKIERVVNAQILEGTAVETETMEMNDAVASGAMALFGEKYGNRVRVVSVGDFSRELCGGTHCRGVGEIGLFKIVKEGSISSGVRRIEALTGMGAYRWMKEQEQRLRDIAGLLRSRPEEVVQRSQRLIEQLRETERKLAGLQSGKDSSSTAPLGNIQKIGSLSVISEKIAPAEIKTVRARADRLRDRMKSGIIIVGAPSTSEKKVSLVVMVTHDLIGRYSAVEIVKGISPLIDGSGGGKAEMAQAGGKRVDKLDAALKKSIEIIQKM
ncbi:MAG: alanine--tRNA ligase [Nitrospiria bacterium]